MDIELDGKVRVLQDIKDVVHYQGIFIKSVRVEIERLEEPTQAELFEMADQAKACEHHFRAGFKAALSWMKGER